ncbi:hypothetical protein RFI_06390 [Reticulomyxa filosa]|uniref:Uncharacterized protein n=1 Tax=Reticulomyxa filosa TaxID=46433 RepID=X6NXW9_RETFI|nr:hypothetical protein RFI_06390 [Reticulomyxa filosa]|eukprot:ETO30728.1 hypothetical protein RFI_06390 [Reticulomyxa filosa]
MKVVIADLFGLNLVNLNDWLQQYKQSNPNTKEMEAIQDVMAKALFVINEFNTRNHNNNNDNDSNNNSNKNKNKQKKNKWKIHKFFLHQQRYPFLKGVSFEQYVDFIKLYLSDPLFGFHHQFHLRFGAQGFEDIIINFFNDCLKSIQQHDNVLLICEKHLPNTKRMVSPDIFFQCQNGCKFFINERPVGWVEIKSYYFWPSMLCFLWKKACKQILKYVQHFRVGGAVVCLGALPEVEERLNDYVKQQWNPKEYGKWNRKIHFVQILNAVHWWGSYQDQLNFRVIFGFPKSFYL